jgi:hypothetical protein
MIMTQGKASGIQTDAKNNSYDIVLSWSGDTSEEVAKLFYEWIRHVIQSAKPWMSSVNIKKGEIWNEQILNTLSTAKIGDLYLTQENKDSTWIAFEAGVLLKGLGKSNVCPFLIDLTPDEVKGPLSLFQHTNISEKKRKEDVFKLIETIHEKIEGCLSDSELEYSFNNYWGEFEIGLSKINSAAAKKPEKNSAGNDYQNEKFAKYMFEREKRLQDERKQANVVATVVITENFVTVSNHLRTRRSYKIEIRNNGLSSAKNVRMESIDLFGENSGVLVLDREKFPYRNLIPESSFELSVMVYIDVRDSYQITLIWDDDFGENRRQEQTISF